MRKLDGQVLRIVEKAWASAQDRQKIAQHLSLYGAETCEREVARVQLAILKLSEGRLDRVPELVAAAKRDYRDVLMWAEFPEEGRTLWALGPSLSPEERARLEEIRQRDRAQYLAWLTSAERLDGR